MYVLCTCMYVTLTWAQLQYSVIYYTITLKINYCNLTVYYYYPSLLTSLLLL